MIHFRSETIDELAKALAVAQGEFRVAELDGANPHFKSRYATLASIMKAAQPGLSKAGLSFIQAPSVDGKSVCVETMLLHASGQTISCVLRADARDTNAQSIGSIISYLKRYGLSSLLGIATGEDDDGEEGGQRQTAKPSQAQKVEQAQSAPLQADPHDRARKFLFAAMNERKLSQAQVKAMLRFIFKQESTKELSADQLDEAARIVKAGPSEQEQVWVAFCSDQFAEHGIDRCFADAAATVNTPWKAMFLEGLKEEFGGEG